MPAPVQPPSRAAGAVPSRSHREPHPHEGLATIHAASVEELNPTALHRLCPRCDRRYPDDHRACPYDGTELVLSDELVGKTLTNTYRIVRVLGEGAMGRVYEARHTRIATKRFALKTLHTELLRHPEILTRFQREAEAAASIASPYVVGVYDVDRAHDGRPFLVSELLVGKELGEHLDQVGKLPLGSAVRIVRQICRALIAAHAQGVVHRDMKPENVFLTGDVASPTAKVLDFGISKLSDPSGRSLTRTGVVMGTPWFMAPEQARGERVDHRVDIYAVGAILYTVLTGKRPFYHLDAPSAVLAVMSETPTRPRAIEPSIPDALEHVIQRAMAKSPGDRFGTMQELHDALARWDTADAEGTAPPAIRAASESTADHRAAAVAPTIFGSERVSDELRSARPDVVLFASIAVAWVLFGFTSAISAGIKVARGGGVTGSEVSLLMLGLVAALLTPAIMVARAIRRVWDDGPRVLEMLAAIREPVLAGLGTYGFAWLGIRLADSLLLERGSHIASPLADCIVALLGLTMSIVVLQARSRRTRSYR